MIDKWPAFFARRRPQLNVRFGEAHSAPVKALDASLLARQGYECSTLWWNLRRLYFYIGNNAGTLVNYGARYRKGLPTAALPSPR